MMFALVQQMLLRDTKKSSQEDAVHPLSGVVYCADCMRAMCRRVVKRGNKSFYYYICSTNKWDKACTSHSFSQKAMEDIVFRAIKRQIELVIEVDKLLSEVEQSGLAATKLKRLDMMIEEKEKEIEGYQEFRRKLLEAFHEKLIDRMEYDAMRQKYSSMIEKAQAALEKIREERDAVVGEAPNRRNWVLQFVKYKEAPKLTREMVTTLIDKIHVYEEKIIRIEFNYRDEIIYHVGLLNQMERAVS